MKKLLLTDQMLAVARFIFLSLALIMTLFISGTVLTIVFVSVLEIINIFFLVFTLKKLKKIE